MKSLKKPLISVVMPVYNRQNYIHHAIQSILDQTFNDWELVIVDDGSTDNTEKVIKLFKDDRIHYFKNSRNRGISYSRNRGNKMASGEILAVQDSDDMSLPDRLEEIYKTFNAFPRTDIVYHSFYVRAMDIRYGARALHRELVRPGIYSKQRALTVPFIPGQLAYRKAVAKKCPYRKELVCWDDWGFIIDATMKNLNFLWLERPLYEYVVSEDSITTISDGTSMRKEEQKRLENILRKEYKLKVT